MDHVMAESDGHLAEPAISRNSRNTSQPPPTRNRAAASYGRRRAANACSICRSRKTKCDNQRPVCGFCAATGGDCRYADSDPSQFDRATLAILQRLGDLESGLVGHMDQRLNECILRKIIDGGPVNATATLAQDRLYDGQSTIHWRPGTLQSPSGHIDATVAHGFDQGNLTSDINEDDAPSSNALRSASEMFSNSMLTWPVFSHAAPHLEKELHTPLLQVWAQASTSVSGHVGKKATTSLNLDTEIIRDLVENFLTNNHIKNPILDVESLSADTREFEETGAQWDERSCLLVRLLQKECLSSCADQLAAAGVCCELPFCSSRPGN
jgi:hypothetical protein